jgi:hypothetical protein
MIYASTIWSRICPAFMSHSSHTVTCPYVPGGGGLTVLKQPPPLAAQYTTHSDNMLLSLPLHVALLTGLLIIHSADSDCSEDKYAYPRHSILDSKKIKLYEWSTLINLAYLSLIARLKMSRWTRHRSQPAESQYIICREQLIIVAC